MGWIPGQATRIPRGWGGQKINQSNPCLIEPLRKKKKKASSDLTRRCQREGGKVSLGSRENLSLEIRKNGARSEREEAKDDSSFSFGG